MEKINLTGTPRLQRQRIGHDGPWQHLTQQFDGKRFHSAWILSGPRGIGKATLAYQMARYILADNGEDPVNAAFYHGLIDQNAHPNMLIIERKVDEEGVLANEIKMDDILPLREFTQKSASLSGWRVIIIDGLEDLNRNAANAILKILEEPPAHTVFLSVSHNMGRVLPTLRSRCCLLPMHPIDEALAQSLGASPLETALAAGSPGRLVQFRELKEHKSATDLSALFETMARLMREALLGRVSEVIAFTGTLAKQDSRVPILLDLLSWMVRRMVLLSSGVPATLQEDHVLSKIAASEVNGEDHGGHWLHVQEMMSVFLRQSQGAHLDQGHLIEACFIMLKSPAYFSSLRQL